MLWWSDADVAEMLCSCQHSMKWMAAGETVTGDGSRLTRGSKRLKTTTAATAQGTHRGLRCNAKPRNQSVKVTWFRLCFEYLLFLSFVHCDFGCSLLTENLDVAEFRLISACVYAKLNAAGTV
jgi:hypothetical protein